LDFYLNIGDFFIVWVLSWIYALSGEKKEIPIVSGFAKKIKL